MTPNAADTATDQSLETRLKEFEAGFEATLEGWARAMDLRDKETEVHTKRVTSVTGRLAAAMGISGQELTYVRWGSILHDVGKLGISDSILLKPEPLDDEEWKLMKMHPVYAYQILYPIEFLRPAIHIPYCHHERWDGAGYPRGLHGTNIPQHVRMFAVVDVWDALRSPRPYRKELSEEQVRDHLRRGSGSHFDPEIVSLFLERSDLTEKA